MYGHGLLEVDAANNLRATIHETVNCNQHISNITNKAYQNSAFL